jgi:uncharacterized membrane protein
MLRTKIVASIYDFLWAFFFVWLCFPDAPLVGFLRGVLIFLGICFFQFFPTVTEQSYFLRLGVRIWSLFFAENNRNIIILTVIGFSCALGVLQTLAFRDFMFDLGDYHQLIWNIAHGHGFASSISKSGNFLLDHLAFSVGIYAPLFWLTGDSPLTLSILYPFIQWLGVVAWLWFAKNNPVNREQKFVNLLCGATLFCAVTFDSLWANRTWGFHENTTAFAASSWAFALLFADEDSWPRLGMRRALILFLLLIAASSKEILILDVAAAIAVWSIFEWRDGRRTRSIFLVALVSFLAFSFFYFESLPHPADKNYIKRYYGYLGNNIWDFLFGILLSPQLLFKKVSFESFIEYFFKVFGPWLFLPLVPLVVLRNRIRAFTPKPMTSSIWLLAIVPSYLSAAISTNPGMRSLSFHYVMELWPLLAILTILRLAQIGSRRLIFTWCAVVVCLASKEPISEFIDYSRISISTASTRDALLNIPAQDKVLADDSTGTWLASRSIITCWPDLTALDDQCPDWAITAHDLIPPNCIYSKVREIPPWILYKKATHPPAKPASESSGTSAGQ